MKSFMVIVVRYREKSSTFAPKKKFTTMDLFLSIAIYLLGALIGAVIFTSAARKEGAMFLDDLLIGLVTCLFSFAGIAFLWLLRQCERIADKHNNPVIWQRNKNE